MMEVNRTNDVIEGIEQSPLFEAADKTKPSRLMHYYGEAESSACHVLSGVGEKLGDVPYRRKPAGNKDELFIGATDRDIILTDMINDLIEVEPVMVCGRIGQGSGSGIKEFCQGLDCPYGIV